MRIVYSYQQNIPFKTIIMPKSIDYEHLLTLPAILRIIALVSIIIYFLDFIEMLTFNLSSNCYIHAIHLPVHYISTVDTSNSFKGARFPKTKHIHRHTKNYAIMLCLFLYKVLLKMQMYISISKPIGS